MVGQSFGCLLEWARIGRGSTRVKLRRTGTERTPAESAARVAMITGESEEEGTLPDTCEGTTAHLDSPTIQKCTRGFSHACARGDDVIDQKEPESRDVCDGTDRTSDVLPALPSVKLALVTGRGSRQDVREGDARERRKLLGHKLHVVEAPPGVGSSGCRNEADRVEFLGLKA